MLCFETKKRAPYKIVFETIDINELSEKDPKLEAKEEEEKEEKQLKTQ